MIMASEPALAEAPGTTVTVKFLVEVHAPNVAVSVYVVVFEGEMVGVAMEGLLRPVVGDQLNAKALLTVLGVNDPPVQMEISAEVVSARLF